MAAGAPAPRLPFARVPGPAGYVGVALDLPVDHLFTYAVPDDLAARAKPGHRVVVPFRGRRRRGLIVEEQGKPDRGRILPLAEVPDEGPLLDASLLALGRFIARYYGAGIGEALAAMIPRGVRHKGRGRRRVRVRLAETQAAEDGDLAGGEEEARLGPRARVLRLLGRHPDGLLLADLCRRAKTSASPVHTLARRGRLVLAEEREGDDELEAAAADAPRASAPTPTDDQARAIEAVEAAATEGAFAPFLLLGVTGSGKTEVYLRAIDAVIARGRQAIVLVPEIALTPQTVRRFRARVERVAVLHSAMGEADRARTWRRIRAGEADVVIGPRSAVFAPVPHLGLIVVDEEHESSFKQQSAPRYHARDVAMVRARAAEAVVLLGSATPALESWRNANEGRYRLLRLPRRIGERPLPTVQVVDRGSGEERVARGFHLARTLRIRIREALREGGQVILLQNRRGFATSVACERCGWVLACEHCDLALTYHRADDLALCHLCGHEALAPRHCPDCALPGLRMRGVGTQTVEDELADLAPDATVARMDSDTMVSREAYEDVLGRFDRREVDVLVGTQMIAKGLHFPGVTLVGIVDADTSLRLPDFRSAERTFGLVAQVAGRAGRGDEVGRVVVQTALPDHPAIRHAARHDFEAFAAAELEDRRRHGYPPFARLLRVVVRGEDETAVVARAEATAEALLAAAPSTVTLLGPAAPTIARLQGTWRRHLLAKAPSAREIARLLETLRARPRPARGLEETWDVDPLSLL